MPKKVKCCVPGCGNNYKTEGPLHFYRIPKDVDVRNAYRLLLRNKCVRLDSENTRICSAHFESGLKLSRCHLPNIFPWNNEEDEKTGEKRKNLEQIASVLKTKKAKANVLSEEQLRDRVQGYQYHVPWRFDGVPLHHGVVSSFKTLEEHEQTRAQTVNTADFPTSLIGSNESKLNPNDNSLFQTLQELQQSRSIQSTSTVDNQRDLIQRNAYNENINDTDITSQSVRFCPVGTVNIPFTSSPIIHTSAVQDKDTGQMPKVSVTLGTLATPIQQSLSNNNWPVRSSHTITYTDPSKKTSSGHLNQLSSMKGGGIQVLHVDRNFFQPGVVTSKQESDISVQILSNSQASMVDNVDSSVQNRIDSSAINNHMFKVQEQIELCQAHSNVPARSDNHTKIYKEVSSQTEVSEEDFQQMVQRMNGMRHENRNLKEEVETLRKALHGFQNVTQCQQFDVTKLENRELTFYTGFENLESLMMFLSIVKESAKLLPVWGKILKERLSGDPETDKLTILGELSLFIMKMKLNLHNTDLAHRFAVTESKVQSVIYTWLQIFYAFSPGSPVHQQLPGSIKSGLRNFGIDWGGESF